MATDEKIATAKLFMNGRSQAVRLPKEFRFEGTEVRVRRVGDAVILESLHHRGWPRGFWRRLDTLRRGLDVDQLQRPVDPLPSPVALPSDLDG